MIDIKKCVKENVTFEFYRKGFLYYKTCDGDIFPVDCADTGDAAFNNQDKGILFMRYMRKFNKSLE